MAMQNDNLSLQDELRQMKSDYAYLKPEMAEQTITTRKIMEGVSQKRARVWD